MIPIFYLLKGDYYGHWEAQALMSSAYSCRALMRPVKVAATSWVAVKELNLSYYIGELNLSYYIGELNLSYYIGETL